MTKEYDLVLSKRIHEAWEDNELVDVVVTGGRGWGKSVYALKVAQGFFIKQGHPPDEAWDMALDCMYFKLEDIVSVLGKYTGRVGERTPIIISDDSSVHLGKYRHLSKQTEVAMLKSMMDVLRTSTACFMMTCPNEEGLLKFLREYGSDRFKVVISKTDGHGARKAVGYNKYTLPSGHFRIYKKFEDHFRKRVPNWVYDKYAPKREKLAAEVIDEIRQSLKSFGLKKLAVKVEAEALGIG